MPSNKPRTLQGQPVQRNILAPSNSSTSILQPRKHNKKKNKLNNGLTISTTINNTATSANNSNIPTTPPRGSHGNNENSEKDNSSDSMARFFSPLKTQGLSTKAKLKTKDKNNSIDFDNSQSNTNSTTPLTPENTMKMDYIDVLTRKLGLSQIPLACVTIRYFGLIVSSPALHNILSDYPEEYLWYGLASIIAVFFFSKIFLGIYLIHYSQKGVKEMTEEEDARSQRLATMERFTVYNGKLL